LLRSLTQFDFKIITAFFSLQIVLSGWLATNPVPDTLMKIGLFIIDIALAGISIVLLCNQYLRRKEVIATVMNLNRAFGYEEPGVYLNKEETINPQYKSRPMFWWYAFAVAFSFLGFCLVLFGTPINSSKSGGHSGVTSSSSKRDQASPTKGEENWPQPGSPPDVPKAVRR
jgi:hypothetical protein